MQEKQSFVALDDYEYNIVIYSLNEMRKSQMADGKHTDAVDDLLIKIGAAPKKKMKVVNKEGK